MAGEKAGRLPIAWDGSPPAGWGEWGTGKTGWEGLLPPALPTLRSGFPRRERAGGIALFQELSALTPGFTHCCSEFAAMSELPHNLSMKTILFNMFVAKGN